MSETPLVPYKKLSARRLRDLSGPRRKKPPIREETLLLREAVENEDDQVQILVRDAEVRRAFAVSLGHRSEPFAVWTDFDQTYLFTEGDPRHLSEWSELTEFMKLQLGFQVVLETGGYSFTINIPRLLETKWQAEGRSFPAMIQKRLRGALESQGLNDLPYAYVIEGRSRSARSRTHLHIHGYMLTDASLDATRFKLATERAFRRLRGKVIGRASDIDIQHSYEAYQADGGKAGRWVSYLVKNAQRWDSRMVGRRLFISRPLTQVTAEFWALLRTDAFRVS